MAINPTQPLDRTPHILRILNRWAQAVAPADKDGSLLEERLGDEAVMIRMTLPLPAAMHEIDDWITTRQLHRVVDIKHLMRIRTKDDVALMMRRPLQSRCR